VFGEGPREAELLLVGEQPGDVEDRAGHPFVGPAGRLLDESLVAAGIDRRRVWLTNAVKHFKWAPRGTRRIHAKPTSREIAACRPWLAAEIAAVRPRLIVTLGATAAQSLLGPKFRVTQHRGEAMRLASAGAETPPRWVMATVHPAAILRAPDAASRRRETARLVADLRAAAAWKPQATARRSRSA
jgi:DNA polymerase